MQSFSGRANIQSPAAWSTAYDALKNDRRARVRELADQVAVILGDKRVYPRFRLILANRDALIEKRIEALEILVRGRDVEAASAYLAVLDEPRLRGPALQALSQLADPETPTAIFKIYPELTQAEKRSAIATLVSRPQYVNALLDEIESGRISSSELHAFDVRQIRQFDDRGLNRRLADVWGSFKEASDDNKKKIADYREMLAPDVVANGSLSNGRRLFDQHCAACHIMFGEGGKVGPDITGSNRANLDYILENILAPNSVLAKEYRMTVVSTVDGRIVSGLILRETDSAITLRTIDKEVVVPKSEIDDRRLSDLSVMPEGLLDPLKRQEVVDLIAYLGSSNQVTPSGPAAPIDPSTGRVPDAIEGEKMKVVSKTAGDIHVQPMVGFPKDQWSGDQLWWINGKAGDSIELEFEIDKPGSYDVEAVFTKAGDYGVFEIHLNETKLTGNLDLFNSPDVITTGVLTYPAVSLERTECKLLVKIIGANPQAIKRYMFGLDYIRLIPVQR